MSPPPHIAASVLRVEEGDMLYGSEHDIMYVTTYMY